jgi:HpcH/HpaI aldolase/citrate lyase family
MTTITWKAKVRAAEPGIGTFLGMGSAVAAEVCALSGFDWLLIDLEHGAGGEDALLGQILAAAVHGGVAVAGRSNSEPSPPLSPFGRPPPRGPPKGVPDRQEAPFGTLSAHPESECPAPEYP